MKTFLRNIWEYIKLVIKEWYWFLGLIPSFLDNLSFYLPEGYHFTIPYQYTIGYVLLVYVIVSYRIWWNTKRKTKEPKIVVDYDLSSFNVCYLVIKNIGNSYAKDIKTIFTPNIEVSGSSLNDSNFCRNITHLEPGKSVRFLFGTFMDQKILKRFDVQISYFDLEGKEKYVSTQVIDPSVFIGTSSHEKESEVVKGLKDITSQLKKMAQGVEEIPKAIKTGVNIRNLELEDLSESDLRILLHNIYLYGSEEDFTLNPYINDTRQIIKYLRNRMLLKDKIDKDDEVFLKKLNQLHNHQPFLGSGNDFKESIKNLFDEIA